jgi:hypothetical protein
MNKIEKALATAKPTKATFKTFVREALASNTLHVLVTSRFDGMTDGLESTGEKTPTPARREDRLVEHSLGVGGVYLVGRGRDWFERVDRDGFRGFCFSNCCGSGFVGIPA